MKEQIADGRKEAEGVGKSEAQCMGNIANGRASIEVRRSRRRLRTGWHKNGGINWPWRAATRTKVKMGQRRGSIGDPEWWYGAALALRDDLAVH